MNIHLLVFGVCLARIAEATRTTYACAESSSNEPILSLLLVASASQKKISCPEYYEKIDYNINANAGG